MELYLTLTMKLIDGEPVDPDWVLDYVAGSIGRQNGAKPPLRVTITDDRTGESTYEVDLVDDYRRR